MGDISTIGKCETQNNCHPTLKSGFSMTSKQFYCMGLKLEEYSQSLTKMYRYLQKAASRSVDRNLAITYCRKEQTSWQLRKKLGKDAGGA